MSSVVLAAKRLVESRPSHRVISLYLNLDPERFATPQARASQVRSLIDQGSRQLERDESKLDHQEKIALRGDLERVDRYLSSGEAPYRGARSLAVFCASRDGLFETVQLSRPVEGRVVIDPLPFVAPLIEAVAERRWCVVLVSRRSARILSGPADGLREDQRIEDEVHGQHDQGGLSQLRYERGIEKEVDDHLRRVAEGVARLWRKARWECAALGGPRELVPRFEAMLPEDVRVSVVPGRVEVDVATATDDQVREAISALVQDDDRGREREALDRLAAGVGTGGRAKGGPEETVEALNERRVQTLLLAPGFDRGAYQCPTCGMLLLGADDSCPADETALEPREHLREAAIEAALAQDAEVMVVRHYPDLDRFKGIAALL
ncbi:MAG TPA: Vms1/Ankzf1 family peptidyl-tRNA hydrolase, partial [Solirubrobacteraceae bacterium]